MYETVQRLKDEARGEAHLLKDFSTWIIRVNISFDTKKSGYSSGSNMYLFWCYLF